MTSTVVVANPFEAGSLLANAINTVKMAQGFARLGCGVTLLCLRPTERAFSAGELAEIYGVTAELRWVQISPRFTAQTLFGLAATPHLLNVRPNLLYARAYALPWLSVKMGIPTVAESHTDPGSGRRTFLMLLRASRSRQLRSWVTISQRLADGYRQRGVPGEKLLVLPDAVDLAAFSPPDRLPASPLCGPGPHVLYAGHLYDYKGIPTILDAASRLPDRQFHFLGGLADDLARQKSRAAELGLKNVHFHGLKPHSQVPAYLWHADLLLLPPSANHPSAAWTSPVKLGEYLASGTPTVASDIPALRDWLTSEEVDWFEPDSGGSLALTIERVLGDDVLSTTLARAGRKRAQSLSYESRAEAILHHALG